MKKISPRCDHYKVFESRYIGLTKEKKMHILAPFLTNFKVIKSEFRYAVNAILILYIPIPLKKPTAEKASTLE